MLNMVSKDTGMSCFYSFCWPFTLQMPSLALDMRLVICWTICWMRPKIGPLLSFWCHTVHTQVTYQRWFGIPLLKTAREVKYITSTNRKKGIKGTVSWELRWVDPAYMNSFTIPDCRENARWSSSFVSPQFQMPPKYKKSKKQRLYDHLPHSNRVIRIIGIRYTQSPYSYTTWRPIQGNSIIHRRRWNLAKILGVISNYAAATIP